MSHSKSTKRGRSQYIERWNPRTKRFVVSCASCGHTGFSPRILEAGFATTLEKQAIAKELRATLQPMVLDDSGRCHVCAGGTKA